MNSAYVDIHDLAIYTGLAESTLYKKVAGKEIPFYKVGKKVLFKLAEVDKWLLGCRVLTAEEYRDVLQGGVKNGQTEIRDLKKTLIRKHAEIYR